MSYNAVRFEAGSNSRRKNQNLVFRSISRSAEGNATSLPPKRLTRNQFLNELADTVVLLLRGGDDLVSQIFIGEPEGAAEAIANQVLGEAAGEVGFAVGDDVPQLEVVVELGTVVELVGRIDWEDIFAVPFFGAPLAGGVEVLQSEADRIDLAVAAGALGLLHVGGKLLAYC
jgi:hypothetical protein